MPASNYPLSIYFCGKEACSPGHSFGPAVRPHYLIHIILDGSGIYEHQGITYHLKKGDAFLISPLESTYYQADSNTPWHYLWIGFNGDMASSVLQQTCFRHHCVFLCPENAELQEEIRMQSLRILQAFPDAQHHPLRLSGMLLELLDLMHTPNSSSEASYPLQYLQKAITYMEHNYSYHLEINEIARYVGIDRSYLYRLFITELKQSPKQYLFSIRIRNAVRMLRSPNYSITETAYSCGFHDTSAFCHYFKKLMNMTPGEFRQLDSDR